MGSGCPLPGKLSLSPSTHGSQPKALENIFDSGGDIDSTDDATLVYLVYLGLPDLETAIDCWATWAGSRGGRRRAARHTQGTRGPGVGVRRRLQKIRATVREAAVCRAEGRERGPTR